MAPRFRRQLITCCKSLPQRRGAAHAEAEDILAKAHTSAEEERRSIYADAAASIADLSVSVASKIVAKTLDEDGEQRRLIERYIEEAGSLNAD